MRLEKQTKIMIGLAFVALLLIARLFHIQIIDDSYKTSSSNNSMVRIAIPAARGFIRDRNGRELVKNEDCYDILVTPKEIEEFDTTTFCKIFGVEKSFIREKFNEYHENSKKIGYQSVVLLKQVDKKTVLNFTEVAMQFPGFKERHTYIRTYPYNAGGNLLGYVSEVDQNYLDKHPEYKIGDYAGKTGIEAAREKELRGTVGEEVWLRNSRNKHIQHYKDGELDVAAIPGRDVMTTIDAELQKYGQELMRNKVGSLVAIEPSTGEILALVSSPCIDVEMLADIGKYYNEIAKDPYKPMFNRAVQASYPPGSVFKLLNGLVGLEEGVLTPSTRYPCYAGYKYGDEKLGCHNHRSPLTMEESIMMSCNAYYCYVLKSILENRKYKNIDEAFDKWHDYVLSFGFGQKLGSDFPAELGGNIPTADYYNDHYGRGRWKANTVISLSIGQGEIGCTPLHLANFAATIANRGFYYIPHIIKESEGVQIDPKYYERHYTMVDTTNFKKVIHGMYLAVNAGKGSGATAAGAAIPGISLCGKTGTAQNPRGADNSVFICFAPQDDPKIAVAAYIEGGGWGGSVAAPIASLLVEKYIRGEISSPERKDLSAAMKQTYLLDRIRVK